MNSKDVRNKWIKFFESKDHLFIPSKSLIPYKDPSLLWINSGVATLKDYFSGKKIPPHPRLVNSQKSIRTNDIENVGVTARHHTFFEMLGNFSIGDYFKSEAIEFANEFIINILKLDKNKIYITYFIEDLEVRDKWISLGYNESQLIAGSKDLNFWDVGSGPCGPNTEIFYDRGEKYHSGGPELIREDIENDRYIEIWNIVFSQYNNLGNNEYVELKQKNIDTGAGLERIVSIMQDVPTNFDTDLFQDIIKEIEKYTEKRYVIKNYFINNLKQGKINKHFKIISDHMRAIVNAINDGAEPSNTQRGYIIRRLIRRAYYSGIKLGIKEKTFLNKLVKITRDTLIFDIDVEKVSLIIKTEEENFSKTIIQGKKILDEEIKITTNFFNVDVAFKLFDTYGFPIEMTNDILVENNIKLNLEELHLLKEKHSAISRGNKKYNNFDKALNSLSLINGKISDFIGYEILTSKSKIMLLLDEKGEAKEINGVGYLVLDKTPFYATSGGQLHDKGYLIQSGNKIDIIDVFKDKNNNHIHKVKGKINGNDLIEAFVDEKTRIGLMRNHSATHLLFAALRKVYGNQIIQLGSDNNQDRLTFDFPLGKRPTESEISKIENFVNSVISSNIKREYIITTTTKAKKLGAIMTIEEMEYFNTEDVRVVKFDDVTIDLCGGTHIDSTKNIEKFKIISVESKGSGIYRIRAISSNYLVDNYISEQIEKKLLLLDSLNRKINQLSNKNIEYKYSEKTDLNMYLKEVENHIENSKKTLKELLKTKKIPSSIDFELEPTNINGIDLYFSNNIDKENVKNMAISIREKSKNSLAILLSKFDGKSILIISSKIINSKDLAIKISKTKKINGGGNNIIWQGISTEEINLKDIKDLI
ncbi:MAG: alanine--tRNA ligase [Metamycoplasmataceae bacterium]